MGNIWGWLIFILSFVAFTFMLKKQQRVLPVILCGFSVILIHHIFSLLNAVYGPFSFTRYDAYLFHLFADNRTEDLSRLNWSMGAELYKAALTLLYKYLGKSMWLGQSVSVLFFAFSCAFLVRIANHFAINSLLIGLALLIFGLLPSSLTFGCFTLRETYMTCFFMLGCIYAYKAIENPEYTDLLLSVVCLLLMGMLHQVMMIYALGLILILFIWFFINNAKVNINRIYFVSAVVVMILLACAVFVFLPAMEGDNYLAMLAVKQFGNTLSLPETIALYRDSINQTKATTQYGVDLSFSTWVDMFKVLSISYVFYIGWPFVGDYSSMSTWVILSEALFRIIALLSLLFIWRDKRIWWFVFAYFSMTFIWNIGTTNHGQALRHHIMTEWVLVLFLMIFVQQCLNKKRLNKKGEISG